MSRTQWSSTKFWYAPQDRNSLDSRLKSFLTDDYRIARINISRTGPKTSIEKSHTQWIIFVFIHARMFHEWAKRSRNTFVCCEWSSFEIHPSVMTWYMFSFRFVSFLHSPSERLRKKGNVWLSSIEINFLHSFSADKNNVSVIIFSQILFTDRLMNERLKISDSPRFARLNCDGACGAISKGASSMKLVVQILSLPANVPTEWRREWADPSTMELELCDKL